MLIYLIENTVNGKVYIGQTTCTLNRRISAHKAEALVYARPLKHKYRSLIYPAMIKYGFDKFQFHILDYANSHEELDKLECWWIEIFHSTNREVGYNLQNGGLGKGKFSKETRKIISESKKKSDFSYVTADWKNKISITMRGEKSSRAKLTQEQVDNIRKEYAAKNTTQRKLAAKYNISCTQINDILHNNTWKIYI